MSVSVNAIIKNKNVSKNFERKIKGELVKLPTNILKTVKNNGGQYFLAPCMSDIRPELKGKTPEGWPEGMTWDDAEGACSYTDAYLFEKVFNKTKASISGDVYHETGHIVDKIFLKATGGLFSETSGFKEVYGVDLLNIYKKFGVNRELKLPNDNFDYFVQGSRPYNHSRRGLEETFAEVFAVVSGSATSKLSNKFIVQNFPNTIKYVDKFMYLFGGKKQL